MNELVTQEPGAVVPQSEAAAFLTMLERAARDPAVDIDKLERLLAMQERMQARNAEAEYHTAFAAMQTEMPVLSERGTVKNKSGGTQSKYTLWEDLNETIKPILSKHGFALRFLPGNTEGGKITVTGVLSHRGGYVERATMTVPLDESGAKNSVQGLGSSTSYGKRYVAISMLNLTSGGEDDDGRGGKALGDKDEWLAKIAAATKTEELEPLWAAITEATAKAGDISAHEELRAALLAQRKELKRVI